MRIQAAARRCSESFSLSSLSELVGMLAIYECVDHSTPERRHRVLVSVLAEIKKAQPDPELHKELAELYESWPERTSAWQEYAAKVERQHVAALHNKHN